MASRISGIASPVRRTRSERVAGRAEPGPILDAPVGCATPIQRLVLRVTFAELKSDFGLRQLGAEIECVRAVGFDSEFVEQGEGVGGDKMAGAVVDVNSVLGRLNAVVVVFHLRSNFCDLSTRVRKWRLVVDLQ